MFLSSRVVPSVSLNSLSKTEAPAPAEPAPEATTTEAPEPAPEAPATEEPAKEEAKPVRTFFFLTVFQIVTIVLDAG